MKKEKLDKIALQSGLEKNKAALAQTNTTIDAARALSTREARVSGSVLFAPPIAKEKTVWPTLSSPITWFKDYCVLKMQRDSFPESETLTSSIDLSHLAENHTAFYLSLLHTQNLNQPNFRFSDDDIIRVKGMIPLSEIRCPPGAFKNPMHDNGIIVMKQGLATGLTFGCPLELMSTVRGEDNVTTQEWAIFGTLSDRRSEFSRKGDSGAAIVGLDGRLGGFLTRGVGKEEGSQVDITYATPAELVFSGIEKEIGCKVVIR